MRYASLSISSSLAAAAAAFTLATPALAAPPDDPVVFAPHPEEVAEERAEKVSLTAEPDLGDRPLVIYAPIRDGEGDSITVETTTGTARRGPLWWLGLSVSPLLAPIPADGRVGLGSEHLTTNRFRACLYPHRGQTCGVVKGFDFKLQLFSSGGTRDYPRWTTYVRTGYSAGRVSVAPRGSGSQAGDATSIQYVSAPVFLGGNIYPFLHFPVRPYAGIGAGVDILKLDYLRWNEDPLVDASGRVGLEVHAGLEGRITNFVTLHAEVMQQWSARRRLEGLPDVSPTGLSVLLGVTAAIPLNLDTRPYRHARTTRVSRTRVTTRR